MDTPPFDDALSVLLNKSARLSFVQGEDRSILLQVLSQDDQGPFDLTGYALVFGIPKALGGSIKRGTLGLPLNFASAQTLNGQSIFTAPAHGLVAGDDVTISAGPAGSLPPPFDPSQSYIVDARTNDTFGLLTSTMQPVVLTAASGQTGIISTNDFQVLSPTLGRAALNLTAAATTAAATGQGLAYQLTLVDPTGRVRIVIGQSQLDVAVQACP